MPLNVTVQKSTNLYLFVHDPLGGDRHTRWFISSVVKPSVQIYTDRQILSAND